MSKNYDIDISIKIGLPRKGKLSVKVFIMTLIGLFLVLTLIILFSSLVMYFSDLSIIKNILQ